MNKQFADKTTVIDGLIHEWGDRIGYGRTQGRKAVSSASPKRRNAFGGAARTSPPKPVASSPRDALRRTLAKTPEVMVKIRPGGMSLRGIKRRMDYIGRWGAVELEDQAGNQFHSAEDVKELMEDWQGYGIPLKEGNRREALHIILSMPAGTDSQGVKDAAREFASEQFEGQKYAFALHTDEPHPHVHLIVKIMGENGVRLNPRKADLQEYRERFAGKLRDEGIQANATRRKARGVVRRSEKQVTLHVDQQFSEGKRVESSMLTRARFSKALAEVAGEKLPQPGHLRAVDARNDVIRVYGDLAKALALSDLDSRQMAIQIVDFVRTMPPATSKHDVLVERVRIGFSRAGGVGMDRAGGLEKGSDRELR